jgi:hypothetical protein
MCSAYQYKSSAVLSVCVPDITTITQVMIDSSASAGNTTSSLNANSVLNAAVSIPTQTIADLRQTWPVLAISGVAALVLSFAWLFIIQWFGSIFVWIIILAFNAILISGSIWLYFYWKSTIVRFNNSSLTLDNWEVTAAFSIFIAVAIIAGLFLIITLALINKIRLAIQIIKEATQAVRAMPLIGKPDNTDIRISHFANM